jgi:hypothetical protein
MDVYEPASASPENCPLKVTFRRNDENSGRLQVVHPSSTYKGGSLEFTGSDGVASDGAQDAGVGQLGLRSDDAVGDVVVQGRVFLLLDILDGTVLEGESVDVGFVGSALDDFGLGEGRGPFGESTELDQGLRGRHKSVR